MKWSWHQAGGEGKKTKQLHVKVRPLKLEGLISPGDDDNGVGGRRRRDRARTVVIKMKWKGPRSGLAAFVPFHHRSSSTSSSHRKNYSSQRFLKPGGGSEGQLEWDEEFESVCDFWVSHKDAISFCPWDVSFYVLYGEDGESRTEKMAVLGKASMNIAELASRTMDSETFERKLPISLQIGGVSREATLSISVSFAEIRNSNDTPPKVVRNSAELNNTATKKKNNEGYQASCCDSEASSEFDSDGWSINESIVRDNKDNSGIGTELKPSETRLDSATAVRLFSWKKRRLSFGLSKRFPQKLNESTSSANVVDSDSRAPTKENERCIARNWEVKEVDSRDGQAKLKANVFFASFDQRSEKAAGESACAVLAVVIAHWLQSNPNFMPTRSQFDTFITEGSSLWRNLRDNGAFTSSFPDNHFDLETVVRADLRPITISRDRSYIGMFSPEKFENLKGAMSFDDVWEEISSSTATEDYDHQKIYIVSWNDHFFVLKVESEAYYIVDSLGERLFEGCNQAYILKFDDSTMMYEKARKRSTGGGEIEGGEGREDGEEREKVICKGKECCKEFIKRFLAAIAVGELEEEERKGEVSTLSLLQRLQIDFHRCSTSSPFTSSSSLTSSSSSLFSSDQSLCI